MSFKILDGPTHVAVIARGSGVRVRDKLRQKYGQGNGRKLKGTDRLRLINGEVRRAEIHWYEANGIGPRDYKIKRYLD